MKARFFLRFSYIGTYFRGAEKLWIRSTCMERDPETIQGVMEIALRKLRTVERPQVMLSSRTDAGVHALANTAHVDIDIGRQVCEIELIGKTLNNFFNKNKLSITVNHVRHVPDTFHARYSAKSRTYLYRFATLKKDAVLSDETKFNVIYPVEEWRRCLFLRHPDFDMEKFREAAQYFPGYHDWTTFMKYTGSQKPSQHNRRTLYYLDIRPGQSMVPLEQRRKRADFFDYWEVELKGRGFVHNQIRRIIGCLKAVALNRVSVEDVKLMLTIPSKHSWSSRADVAPPHGLYLTDVEYDPQVFKFDQQNVSVQQEECFDE